MSLLGVAADVVVGFVVNLASDGINPTLLNQLQPHDALRNDHLEKAVETAYLRAFDSLISACLSLEGEPAFTGVERNWLEMKRHELRSRLKGVDGAERLGLPVAAVDEVAALVTPNSDEARTLKVEVQTKLLTVAMDTDAPPRFQTYLKDQLYDLVALFFCDTLKHDPVVNNIFQGQVQSSILSLERANHALLTEILARLPQLAPEVRPLSHVAAIPHPLNPNFTGREQLLAEVRQRLDATGRTVLHGMGGVGKTQLAVQYAHRNAGAYGTILWVPAERDLQTAFLALADRLGLPTQDATKAVQAVKEWLAKTENWLLVFDNANGPAEVGPFLPNAGRGHVLLTSRNPHWLALGIEAPAVPLLPEAVAAEFLQCRTGRHEPGPVLELARELGGLPLALEQAGAYVEQMQIPLARYLDLYREHRQRVLERGGAPVDYNRQTVGTTWEISFAKLRPAAAALLNLCAFLAPDDIPEPLILYCPFEVPEILAAALLDPLERDELVPELAAYSLVTRDGECFSVHRLVQQAVRERLTAAEKAAWAEAAVRVVFDLFPRVDGPATWQVAALLAPHALTASDRAGRLGLTLQSAGWLYNEVARLREKQGVFSEAERLYRSSLAIAEQLGDNAFAAVERNNLGGLLWQLDRMEEARSELEQALSLKIDLHGLDHPDTAVTLTGLALVLQRQGDLKTARALHAEALRIFRHKLGDGAVEVAMALNNMGTVLRELGDLAGARIHYESAVAIDQETLSDSDPTAINHRRNLGAILTDLGELEDADTHLQIALQTASQVYGHDHPEVAQCWTCLGTLQSVMGDFLLAREYFTQALKVFLKYYGPDHPDTIYCRNALQKFCVQQGDK